VIYAFLMVMCTLGIFVCVLGVYQQAFAIAKSGLPYDESFVSRLA